MKDSNTKDLTPQQESAIDILALGRNLTDTAQAVKVARKTVSQWVNHHPAFQMALRQRRSELLRDSQGKLHALLPLALEAMEKALHREHFLQAAVHILKATGVYGFSDDEIVEAADEQETPAVPAESRTAIKIQHPNQIERPQPSW